MPRGVIVVRVKEAHGRNKKDDIVWEQNFIEGFVRAELRGADKSKLTVGIASIFRLSRLTGLGEDCTLCIALLQPVQMLSSPEDVCGQSSMWKKGVQFWYLIFSITFAGSDLH